MWATMDAKTLLAALLVVAAVPCQGAVYKIPVVKDYQKGAFLKAPVGVSIEFFTFAEYFTKLGNTRTCIGNLGKLFGEDIPVRIGGTTQDRALYDPNLRTEVSYHVASPKDAPANLTYGPSYIDLAATLPNNVTLGVNRRLDEEKNSAAAAKYAFDKVDNLYAVELGNEPDLYGTSSPIAKANGGKWDPATDAKSQTSWQKSIAGDVLKSDNIIQAGVRLQPSKGWNIVSLAPVESSSGALKYVKSFGLHSYPQSACSGSTTHLDTLMSHSGIVSYSQQWKKEVAAAQKVGKPLYLSETNSATCGGGGISNTFGAGLWVMDYVIQSLLAGVSGLHFHHGTIGNSPYSWWGRDMVYAPYYGAYTAAAALSGVDHIEQLDDGKSANAAYALYREGRPVKVLLYNSATYQTGSRSSATFTVSGITSDSVKAKRVTAQSAYSTTENGQNPTFASQTFDNKTCEAKGQEVFETADVSDDGSVDFVLKASEALLVYL